MRKMFESMDKDFDGCLTEEELVNGLKAMGNKDYEKEA